MVLFVAFKERIYKINTREYKIVFFWMEITGLGCTAILKNKFFLDLLEK